MFIAAVAAAAAIQTATPAAAPAAAPSVHQYSGLALSPDGKTIVTFEAAGSGPGQQHGVITLRDATGAVIRTLDPCTTCRYSDAAWTPDGKGFAVVASDMKAGTATIYSVPLAGGDAVKLNGFTGLAARLRWSPDGRSLAMLAVVNPHKQVGATQAGAARVGEIGSADSTDEQRITTVPAAGGDLGFVSPSDTWVYEYDWRPDGRGFVATAAKGDGDNNWWVARLEGFGMDGSETVLAAPKMQMNYPRVTPDGRSVLFIGGLMSDFGSVGGDVWSVPITGGEPKDLTSGAKVTFTSLTVTKGGVYAGIISGGDAGVASVNTMGGFSVMTSGPVALGGLSFSADGKWAAAVTESYTQAPAIAAGAPGAMKALTHDNDGFTVPFTARSITWNNDGFDVQGWLLVPNSTVAGQENAKKTYPMITVVHGGPSSAYTPRFSSSGSTYDLLKAGYYVFLPNPRGSYGQGEAFVQSNRRDFGGGDLRDILAGIDAVEKAAPVDDARLGVMGHSYGGLMTMWTVTHSNRFKAAIAGAGIANWSSYYGENGIDQWMIPFFGASFYDDPAIYDKLSPIRYIKDAHTPTFIYVGERDVECPPDQSIEFWHGLKEMGVETTLVIYEGEGHGIRDPKHTQDLSDRETRWWETHLGQP